MARLPAEVAAARIENARSFFRANPDATVEAFQVKIKTETGMRMSPNLAYKIREEVTGNAVRHTNTEVVELRQQVAALTIEVSDLKTQLAARAAPVPTVTGATQHERVLAALRAGATTLSQIATMTGDSAASVSARIRDLRKAGHDIVREHVVGGDRYSLTVAVSAPVAA